MSESLADWLAAHGMDRFLRVFEENEVDLTTLRALTEADLKELNIPFGPRKRILHALADEKAAKSAPAAPTPAGERRQLTILFCDMVGFTRLAYQLDPERLQPVIRAYENACAACVGRYDGYVFTTLGDGVVAFFGYPVAHESEAERAIRAGLDIVEAVGALHAPGIGRLQVRVGIATGLVVVAPGERNAVGEAMSLASRLQAIADPGSVVVSEQVRELAGGAFVYQDLGDRELKGVSSPTGVYRVLGLSGAESRFAAATSSGVTPLVGRRTELEAALEAWERTRATQTGRTILLSGDGGIGKSRIVVALRDRLGLRVRHTLFHQASPFFTNSAFHPIVGWLERTLGLRPDDRPQAGLDKLEAYLADRFAFATAELRLIAAMLSTPFQDRYGAIPLSPRLTRAATIQALTELARAHANDGPTLIVFEDLHWADPTTREYVEALVARLSEIPALLVVTARPEFQPVWSEREGVVGLRLRRFEPKESRELLAQVVSASALPKDLVEQIVTRAEGVPLFVEELTKAMVASLNDAAARVALPATLRDSLMARLDRVPAAKEIAQVGSMIGREFSYELLASLKLMTKTALDAGLAELTASGLVRASGEGSARHYTFSHALLQDAAYESLLKSRRRRLHAEVAQQLTVLQPQVAETTPEWLAYHYAAAGRHRLAAPLWLKASENAMARFALAESLSHLHAGLKSVASVRPSRQRDLVELNLRSRLGPALVAQRGWGSPDVAQALEPAWRLAQSLDYRDAFLPILSALAVHTMSSGALSASLEWCRRMVEFGTDRNDDALVLVGRRSAAASRFWLGDFAAARREGDIVHRLYDADRHGGIVALTNSDPLTGEGIYRSQFLWMMGFPEQALAAQAVAEANARRHGHPFDLAFLLTLGAQLFGYLGEWQELLRRADEAVSIGRERGISLLSEILAEISRGVAWLQAQRAHDAAQQLEISIGRLRTTGHNIWVWYLSALQAQALAETGRFAEAVTLMDGSLAKMEAGEERVHYAETLRLRGWLAIRLGDSADAESYLRRALEVAQAQGAKSWELRAATTLSRLLAGRGARDEALSLLRSIYGQFSEGFDTRDLQQAGLAIEELERSDGGAPG